MAAALSQRDVSLRETSVDVGHELNAPSGITPLFCLGDKIE